MSRVSLKLIALRATRLRARRRVIQIRASSCRRPVLLILQTSNMRVRTAITGLHHYIRIIPIGHITFLSVKTGVRYLSCTVTAVDVSVPSVHRLPNGFLIYFGYQLERELDDELYMMRHSGPRNLFELLSDEFTCSGYYQMRSAQHLDGNDDAPCANE